VIYVTKDQVAQVKYLLEQAIQGNHILFCPNAIKRILATPAHLAEGSTYGAEPHVEKLMSLKGLANQRAYLERLDPITFESVVRTYMNIVENTLSTVRGTVH
jgi:hypothetical protein